MTGLEPTGWETEKFRIRAAALTRKELEEAERGFAIGQRGYVHETPAPPDEEIIAHHVQQILDHLGYDRLDQHFRKTPQRVAKWLLDFARNGDVAAARKLLAAEFDDEHDSLVLTGPTKVTSMCAHHMLPVIGNAWVGYIPNAKIVGLSKLSRIVHYYARQFTVQERVTQQIADTLWTTLEPVGVMVVIEAEHGCMSMRGVSEANAKTVTSAVRGVHKDDQAARDEFLALMKLGRPT